MSRTLHDFKALLDTAEPARLGPEKRGGTLSTGEIDEALGRIFPDGMKNEAFPDLVRALGYLWHDHLDAAHRIAQELETADGSLVHAMMHRREPDYGNAKYWYRRAGRHPAFLGMAAAAEEVLGRAGETDLLGRLAPNKTWDPFAFVDAVEDAERGQFKANARLLESLQNAEFELFLENLVHRME